MPKITSSTEIVIEVHEPGEMTACIVGTSPFICNRMSEKAKRELLFPSGRKNAAARETTMKHNPVEEYRNSAYLSRNAKDPTHVLIMGAMLKGAMRGAALDIPGTAKSQIGRLIYVPDFYVPIYGVPELFMSTVRNLGMNRTPDIRTRAIIPKWAVALRIRYNRQWLNEKSIMNLLNASGSTQGIGDWRPEKGSGNFGQFEVVSPSAKVFKDIVKQGGRKAQVAAYEKPRAFDDETAELFNWFTKEAVQRGRKVA